MRKDILAIIAFAVLAVIMVSCSSSDSKKDTTQTTDNPTSMNFVAQDIDGNTRYFDEFKGKGPVIINFWGTWCPPCKREMPDLKRIYDEYKDQGLQIVGLAVNDTPEKVKAFAKQYGIDWVMLMANRDAMISFQIGAGIPVTIFIDRNGNETGRYVGMRSYNDFKTQVEKII